MIRPLPSRFPRMPCAASARIALTAAVILMLRVAPVEPQARLYVPNEPGNSKGTDTGEVMARVTAESDSLESVGGFVHFPIIRMRNASAPGPDERFLDDVEYTLGQHTLIEVRRDGILSLDSPKLHRYPCIVSLFTGLLSETEEQNLRNYLTSGGFAFLVLGGRWGWKEFYSKFARIEPIPRDHPIYRASSSGKDTGAPPLNLQGIWIGKRLVGMDISGFRSNIGPGNSDDRYRKLLAACMVYALTR